MIRTISAVLIFASLSFAAAAIPALKITPLGKPDAPVSGTLQHNLAMEPENLSPLIIKDTYARWVSEYTNQALLFKNYETDEFEPELAENYEVSKDGLTFTFYLNKKAHWSDGKPVTAEDVKFSIEAVKDPAYQAVHRQPFYDQVESITTPDEHTIIFKMKKRYYMNLEVLGTIGFTAIVPKAHYVDPKRKWDTAPIVGSGPYKVSEYNRGKNLLLVRDKNWWGGDVPGMKARGKFEQINFRFIKDPNLTFEMVKKEQIDYMYPVRIEIFEKKAVGEPFGTKIAKIEAENKIPKPWAFVGWNQKNPIFKDKNVRIALSHLLNRKFLFEKFFYGKAVEAVSPFYYAGPFNPPGVKPIDFNPEKAKALLKKAGWEDKEKTGILQKTIDGKNVEFRFALLLPNREVEKYFTIYKEDLKKAGIDMEIKLIEWSTFSKLLDEQKFDAVAMAWGGGSNEDDLKQIWHSDSAKNGGSNFISYSNKEVDKYIDEARQEMNAKKRRVLWQKAAKLIAEDQPYTFFYNLKYDLMFLNKRIGFDKPTYTYYYSNQFWFPMQ